MSVLERLNPRDRRAVVLGFLLIMPALLWVGAVRPYQAALDTLRDRVRVEQDLYQREVNLLAMSEDVLRDASKAHHRGRAVDERLVLASNRALAETELTSELEIMGVESRVLIEGIRSVSQEGSEVDGSTLLPLRLAVEGESDLQGILGLIERIENHRWLIRIGGLTVTPETESGDDDDETELPQPTGVVRFGLIVEAYTRPPTPETGSS